MHGPDETKASKMTTGSTSDKLQMTLALLWFAHTLYFQNRCSTKTCSWGRLSDPVLKSRAQPMRSKVGLRKEHGQICS